MYRTTSVHTVVAEDQNLNGIVYERRVIASQVKDRQVASVRKLVAPADAETQVLISPLTTGYYIHISSDYPIMVRINGSSATQFTLKSNNVPAVNVGAPLPHQCVFEMTGTVTSVYVEPIAGANQTANVDIVVTGDPTNVYT